MSTPDESRNDWGGIVPAMLTPLTEDERLDEGACERLAGALLDQGLSGLYLTGNTGEGYGLDDEVRAAVYGTCARVAASRGKGERIIAHVGGVHLRRAVALAREAAEAGCDAIAALPPSGVRYSYEEVMAYYAALAEATALPLFAYYIPSVTGIKYSREQLSALVTLPGVQGLKFTHMDLSCLERLVTLHPEKHFFFGSDQMLMHGLVCGACGAIGTTYNLIGPLALKIADAVARGDLARARKGQAAINDFVEVLFACGGRSFKALAAAQFGWASARSPAPGITPGPDVYAPLERALERTLAVAEAMA